jgi:hypothetical protein
VQTRPLFSASINFSRCLGRNGGVCPDPALPPAAQQAHVLAHPPLAALVPPSYCQGRHRNTKSRLYQKQKLGCGGKRGSVIGVAKKGAS